MNYYAAIAANEREFEEILAVAKQNRNAIIECLCYEFRPEPKHVAKNLILSIERYFPEIISKQEAEGIDKQALFFTRNWHKLGKGFEQKINYKGIQLAFVSEHAFFSGFKDIFAMLKALQKLDRRKRLKGILATEASFMGKCAKIASGSLKTNFVPLNLPPEKKVALWQEFNVKKLKESLKKASEIAEDAFFVRKKPGAKTVFVRSRCYLGKIHKKMQLDKSLNVVSLDNFLVKKLLNPVNFLAYMKARAEKRAFFMKAFEKYQSSPSFREKLVFEEMNFAKALDQYMPIFSERAWPEFTFLIDNLLKEFEKKKPSGILLWEDLVPFERICTLIAKKTGTKSLVAQHGLFGPNEKKGDWISGYAPLIADKIAVWGNQAKNDLVSHQVEAERIVVTGGLRLDALHNRKFNPELLRKQFGVKKGEKMIVLSAEGITFDTDIMNQIIEWIRKDLGKTPKKHFVTKVKKGFEDKKKWQKRLGSNAKVVSDIDLYELLNACDVIIGKVSTLGLEGMILGKPFISFGVHMPPNNNYKGKGVIRVKNRKELIKATGIALSGKNRKRFEKEMEKFVYKIAYKQDGKATERAIALMKKMMESNAGIKP